MSSRYSAPYVTKRAFAKKISKNKQWHKCQWNDNKLLFLKQLSKRNKTISRSSVQRQITHSQAQTSEQYYWCQLHKTTQELSWTVGSNRPLFQLLGTLLLFGITWACWVVVGCVLHCFIPHPIHATRLIVGVVSCQSLVDRTLVYTPCCTVSLNITVGPVWYTTCLLYKITNMGLCAFIKLTCLCMQQF